ncbi:MAG: FUSC family protein [Flavobacterium sp.]|nr:FUSC family protein [Flavobacterium sp.]
MNENKEQIKLSEMTDQELLLEAKRMRSTSLTNAVLIGFLIGVIIYGVVNDSIGFLAIIPLFMIYKLVNSTKYKRTELQNLLKERNIKVR